MGTPFYCFDLTSATDRFPIVLIHRLLISLIGKEKALAWYNIMVGYSFVSVDSKGSRRDIKYSVGNPMGLLSSWGTFTLCHHFLVYVCCRNLGKTWSRSKYILLGDDIIIYDESVALEYKKLISDLGVEISDAKSHVSKNFMEFAKRYFYKGIEISPFPLASIDSISRSYSAFIDIIFTYKSRGWVPIFPVLQTACDFYKTVSFWKVKTLPKVYGKVEITWEMFRLMKGFSNDLKLVNLVLVTLGRPTLGCSHSVIARSWISTAVCTSFNKSAENFLSAIESAKNPISISIRSGPQEFYVSCHPYSDIYRKYVFNAYRDAGEKAYIIDTKERGVWTPFFRVVIGAHPQKVFTLRDYALVSSAIPLLVLEIKQTITDAEYYSQFSYI